MDAPSVGERSKSRIRCRFPEPAGPDPSLTHRGSRGVARAAPPTARRARRARASAIGIASAFGVTCASGVACASASACGPSARGACVGCDLGLGKALDLPALERAQGQSLAPLLLGQGDWKPRPVILDEFVLDRESGELRGLIEVIDGWWGASLEINPGEEDLIGDVGFILEDSRRPAPLLLYDLRSDPFTLHSLHEERPELVEKYRRFLLQQWEAHQQLNQRLGEIGQVEVDREQLEALRALGYLD